jgi:manganese/iron transport system substrate-binding protein
MHHCSIRPRGWFLSMLLATGLGSCQILSPEGSAPSTGQPRVVTTSTILEDLTDRVGDDQIQLTGILAPGADPHVYEPVPADSRALEQAALIFYNGYNLEPALIQLIQAAGVQAEKVAVGEVVSPLGLTKERRMVPDPHVWGDVQNVIRMVEVIRDELIQLSPDQEAKFNQNAAQLITQLQQLDTWIGQQIATIPASQRKLVTTHDAFQYYGNAYGLTIVGTLIGISTEEQPSAQTTQRLIEAVKDSGVPTIFAETTINPALIRTVAEEAGVSVAPQALYSDSIGAPGSGADSYIQMMVTNTRTIVEALGGQYQPLQLVVDPPASAP